MEFTIREMSADDHAAVTEVWRASEGIALTAADEPDGFSAYLHQNPGTSFVALAGGRVVGAVLGGHDGRRGFLHHLAVEPAARNRGIGAQLAQRCLDSLRQLSLEKVHIFVYADNQAALGFWQKLGFVRREELALLSFTLK